MPANKPAAAASAAPPAVVDPDFLTLEEVAERLKFSPRTMRRRIKAGLIRPTLEGGRHLIAVEDYYAYLERLRRAGKRPSSRPRRRAV